MKRVRVSHLSMFFVAPSFRLIFND